MFWVKRPFETVFQSISGRLPERGRKKREMIDERKNVQTTPTAPSASAIGLCPTNIKIVGRPGTGSLPSTFAPPLLVRKYDCFTQDNLSAIYLVELPEKFNGYITCIQP